MTAQADLEHFTRLLTANVITRDEHAALILRYHHHLPERTCALALNISRRALRDRIANAHRKIGLHSQETA